MVKKKEDSGIWLRLAIILALIGLIIIIWIIVAVISTLYALGSV